MAELLKDLGDALTRCSGHAPGAIPGDCSSVSKWHARYVQDVDIAATLS